MMASDPRTSPSATGIGPRRKQAAVAQPACPEIDKEKFIHFRSFFAIITSMRIVMICERPKYLRCDYDETALADFLLAKRLLAEHGYGYSSRG